ncbi:MAG: ATP-binding protein [Planctomycetota bacterium]
MDFLRLLFDGSDFSPRWFCGRWTAIHGWLHILSDIGVWSAYLAIPFVLGFFIFRKSDLPFRGVFVLFGMFILACGMTHLMEAVIFWWPAYRLLGLIKLITAVVSWTTVLALIPIVPKALAMRSPEELAREIDARQHAEGALRRINAELEQRVAERTAALEKSNTELHYQREWFRTTLASIGDAVITTDTEGRVTSLNAVAERLTAWTGAEALTRPINEIFAVVDERSRETIANPIHECLRKGVVVGLANHALLIGRDQKETPIDDSAAPIRNADGVITGSVLVFRDVSERRAAQDSILEAVTELRTLVELSPIAIFRSNDARGDDVTGNPAARAMMRSPAHGNLSMAAAPGSDGAATFAIARDGRMLKAAEFPMQHALRTGAPLRDWELEVIFPDGEIKHIVTHAMPFFDRQGEVRGGYMIATDVTSLQRLAAQLQEADRRKDEFLATLAHELRNPLAPVRNALHILNMTDGVGEAARLARATMERQVHHMVRLVDDLLDVSRISRGKLDLRKIRVDVASVVQIALETSRPLLDLFDHRVHVDMPDEPIWLDADPVRLAQIIANLLNNAAKYTDRGGEIWVRAEATQREAMIAVRDSGVGIPAEMLSRVFDLFAQVDRTLDRTQGGLGIGLRLVKQLVELHGGTVTATSEGLDRGSEFVVRLPRADAPVALGDPNPRLSSEGANVSRRILVVDDNRDAADSLAEILQMCGHRVAVAYEGPTAIALADENPPEIAILDLGIPQMSGHEIGATLRARPWGQAMLLVALTGWGQEADKERTRASGFDLHLVKPVDVDTLLKTINNNTRLP